MTAYSTANRLLSLSLSLVGGLFAAGLSSRALCAEAPAVKKHFSFPSEFAVGNLHLVSPEDPKLPGEMVFHDAVVNARGSFDFAVPAGNLVVLKLGSKGVISPPAVLKSDPTNIDALVISYLSVDTADEKVTADIIKIAPHFSKLQGLLVDRSDATDADLVVLKKLPDLRYLSVFMTTVTGDFLRYLPDNSKIVCLQMGHIPLEEEKLAVLPRLKNLKTVFFSHTNVTTVGAQYLAGCAGLEAISLADSHRFDDRALALLLPLKHLQVLHLEGTHITVAGLCKLKGLPLASITLSQHLATPANMAVLKSTFPRVVVAGSSHKVDSENNAIFAPLH